MRRQAFDVLVIGPTEREFLFATKADAVGYGSVLEVKEVPVSLSGSGANVAVGLSRLGLKVGLVTALGRDVLGDQLVKELSAEGVETGLIARVSLATTGLAMTVFRERGGNAFVVRSGGANDLLEVTEEVQTMLHTTKWVYIAGISGAWETVVTMLLETLRHEQTRLAWAPGALQIRASRQLVDAVLERAAVLFVSAEDAKELSGRSGTHEALEMALASRGVDTVCLSLGRGDLHVRKEQLHLRTSVPHKTVVDPRGADDAFRAGFLAGLQHTEDAATALQWGVMNATSVAGTYTTQRGLLAKSVLEERLRTQPVAIDKSATES